MKKSVAASLILWLSIEPAWGVKHILPGVYPNAKHDMVHRPTAMQMKAFGSMHAAITGGAAGAKTVAVLLVQFPTSTCGCTSGSNTIQSLGNIDTYFNNMNTYFKEVSYNNILSITFRYFGKNTSSATGDPSAMATGGAMTLTNKMEYYGCGDEGSACAGVRFPGGLPNAGVNANGNYLIRDALTQAMTQTGGGPKSTASGGSFNAIIVMHAGDGNETTLANGDIWSIFYSQDSIISSAGSGFTEGDVVPEIESSGITSPLGVMCHEFGHELGLPDEYNTTSPGGASVVGNWELMDSGPFDGNGANPSHMGAWDKQLLGWNNPTTVTTAGTQTVGFAETNPTGSILKLPAPNGLTQEYFLVEYRSKSASPAAYDQKIPGTGILIWHIDDAITGAEGITGGNTVNASPQINPHYGISIVTADGVTISNTNQGDAGNAFINKQNFITPQANNFAGKPSGVSIVNIRNVGTSQASMDVADLAVSAGESIAKAANYPNPAGKGYAHPSGEGHTTIQFQLTRPAQDYSINIYTLSADLVRKIGKDQINLNVNRSADNKWVYEFDWDLTNGDGAHVAPGVYFYLVRADGETKTGKAVVIR